MIGREEERIQKKKNCKRSSRSVEIENCMNIKKEDDGKLPPNKKVSFNRYMCW